MIPDERTRSVDGQHALTGAEPTSAPTSEDGSAYAPRIKCCGMMRTADIDAVNRVLPDYAGFIIDFPKSHRSLDAETAAALASRLDDAVKPVAVVVDQPLEEAVRIAEVTGAFALQLHGHEDAAYVQALRSRIGCAIWQAFKVRSTEDLARADASPADLLLLDNGTGTGQAFDWQLACAFAERYRRPFLLAGGLTPENIPDALQRMRPFGVDISSGIETERAKDPDKIAAAVQAVRAFAP